jgi:phosphate/phosphite/phosphonate ABC transporter binding protein
MTKTGRIFVFRVSIVLLLLLVVSGCDSGRSSKVEVLSGSAPGKKLIRVAASDEAYVHFIKLAEDYSHKSGVQFDISQAQGKDILGLIEKKTVDIGVAARRLDHEKLGGSISYIPYAYDGAVFLAATDAKVRSLSLAQARQILQGKITNWKEVGGADKEIRVINRPVYSAVPMSLGNSLFNGELPRAGSSMVMETSESAYQAMRTLSSYFAYAPLSRITVEHFPSVPLTIEGMPPLITNVPAEKYPTKIEYSLLIPREAPPEVIEFANYTHSVEAVHFLASIALVPVGGKMSLSACHCRATEGTFMPTRGSSLAGTFTIAVVPELGAIQQENRYSGISRLIAEEMGMRTQLKHLESYERVVREFQEGRVDTAFVGSLVYGQLHERLGVVPLARPESGKVSRYQGLVIVRADSGIRNFAGLGGKSFAYVPDTSAGELFTRLLLSKSGKAAEREFFSRVARVSTHADAVQMVAEGKVDGAAVKDLVLKRMIGERGKGGSHALKENIRILESSHLFPENALVVSATLDPKQSAKLRDILLSCDKKEAGRAALKVLGAERFIRTGHEDYAKMYEMAQEAGYSFRKK